MNGLTNSTAAAPAEAPKFAPSQLVPNALLSTPDTGTVMRASRATIYAWIADGLLTPPIKLGSKSSASPFDKPRRNLIELRNAYTGASLPGFVVEGWISAGNCRWVGR